MFYVYYSTPLHLPPLRFHCVGGYCFRTQGCCDFDMSSISSTYSILTIFQKFTQSLHRGWLSGRNLKLPRVLNENYCDTEKTAVKKGFSKFTQAPNLFNKNKLKWPRLTRNFYSSYNVIKNKRESGCKHTIWKIKRCQNVPVSVIGRVAFFFDPVLFLYLETARNTNKNLFLERSAAREF